MNGSSRRSSPRRALVCWAGLAWALAGLGLAGCSKDELNELVEKGKSQVEQASQSVAETTKNVSDQVGQAGEQTKQQLGQAGDMQLQLDAPLKTSGCYVRYLPPLGGRPGVLQLRSYAQAEGETFPSVLIRCTTSAENAAALRDQNLTGAMFVQGTQGGPVWQSEAATPVQLKVTQVDDKTFVAEITGGAMRSFPDGKAGMVNGRVTGVWQ